MNRLKINKMKNNRICIYKLKEIIMKNNRTGIDKLGESRMNIDRLKQNIIKLAGIILVMAAVSGIAGCGKVQLPQRKYSTMEIQHLTQKMMRQMSIHITDIQAGRA